MLELTLEQVICIQECKIKCCIHVAMFSFHLLETVCFTDFPYITGKN